MNERMKEYSLCNFSYMEEMKAKLQKLDSVRQATETIIAQLHLHPKSRKKWKKSTQQKSISMTKRRTLQPLLHRAIEKEISDLKTPMNMVAKSAAFHPTLLNDHPPSAPYSVTSPSLNSPPLDEVSITSPNDKLYHDSQENSRMSESFYRKYRTTHSTASSSSPSKNSCDEPPLTPDTLIIGRLYILNEIYPSMESKKLIHTPLAFLGAEKLLHHRVDWTNVRYPLSATSVEIIIDLIITRPSFIREIPKVTNFNLYRPLIQTVSGRLFFDRGECRAGMHRCHRKLINHKFTIEDLASIHKREFYIINYNVVREQRFINLYESLYQTNRKLI